jgi:WD40 repeat protein/serine/threonine protein kinase
MSLEGQQIHRYRIVRLLGSGGMGDVYLAEDPRIEQQVAIKVIRAEASSYPETQDSQEAARLFQREARAIAKLDHPHILPLYDYGEERMGNMTVIYLVMPYRREGSLSDWLRQTGQAGLLVPQDVAHFVGQAANALQHAHDRQIIHQDVKPSNFLLRHRQETPARPDLLLADFGIARFSTTTASASQSIRGTPTSMAPEQWEGHPVPATDQYALAVMAYELLTGRPPFKGAPGPLMYQHLTVLPPPPSSVNPHLSGELDAVLLHAMAKRPEQRFASIMAFANAFQQAVRARTAEEADAPTYLSLPPTSPPKSASSGNLRAVLAISTAEAQAGTTRTLTLPGGRQVTVSVPAGVRDGQVVHLDGKGETSPAGSPGGALILSIQVKSAEEASPLSTASAAMAQSTVLTASPTAPATSAPTVRSANQQPSVSSAVRPEMTMPASPSTQPTQAAMPVSQVVPTATELALPKKPLVGRPSETTLPAQVGQQAGVMPTGRVPIYRARPLQPPVPVTAQPQRGISRRTVVLGLAGLAVVGVAGGGLIWLARSQQSVGTTLYTYHGHSNIVRAVAWNPVGGIGMPNGQRIASASNDWTVQVWDAVGGDSVAVDGGNVFTYRGHSGVVDAVAWAPHGRRIASGSYDSTVQVWNAADGGHVFIYRGHASVVNAVAWSPDGTRIASASRDKTVQVWESANGGSIFAYRGHSSWVNAVAWSPDGRYIASGSSDNTVQVWDAADGGNIFTYRGHASVVNAVAWSPDGRRIASGSADKTVQVWDAVDGGNVFTYRGHSNEVLAVAWSPNGKRIASGGGNSLVGTVQVWDAIGGDSVAVDGGNVYTYHGHASAVLAVAWSPDGKDIASGSRDKTVQVWVAE